VPRTHTWIVAAAAAAQLRAREDADGSDLLGASAGDRKAHSAAVAKARGEAEGRLDAEVGLAGLDEVVEERHILSACVAPEMG
jgi:hypothetical protein